MANALDLTELLFVYKLLGALFCHALLLMSVLDVLEDLVLFDFGFARILFTLFWEHSTIIYVFSARG